MNQCIDNLKLAGLKGRLRTGGVLLVGLAVTLGAVGVPLQRLHDSRARQERFADAEVKLRELRAERRAFIEAGGGQALAEQRDWVSRELPRGLTRIDLRATTILIAQSSGLELQTLAVGEFEDAGFEHLEDAVGRAEIQLKAVASPSSLVKFVERLRGLGLPTVVLDLRLRRLGEDASETELSATLGIHQSIPIPASSSPTESEQEFPQ